jgi:pimeloyl-ACP methyl ester carboxylesterase
VVNVYFISGLAADRSVFKHIRLPSICKPVFLDWLEPLQKETLVQYALRMAAPIDVNAPFALVGLSFGGMIAIEIAKTHRPVCTILISSIPSIHQLPAYYKFAGRIRLHQIIPIGFLQNTAILKRFFTTETAEDKRMLKALIRKSRPRFVRWALHAILTWRNTEIPKSLVHIHGTKDEILPIRFTKPTHIIRGGGHLMVLNRANEISKILSDVLLYG